MPYIQGYTQQVTNTSGSGSVPKLSISGAGASANARAQAGANAIGLGKAMGQWVDVINKVNEQKDRESALTAMDEYNKAMNETLYNKETGLMYQQMESAADIDQKFTEASKKAREAIMSNTKMHFAANSTALQHFFDSNDNQTMARIQKHQYGEREKVLDAKLQSNIDSLTLQMQSDYSPEGMARGLAAIDLGIDARVGADGGERSEQMKKKARANAIANVMQFALSNNDIPGYQDLYNQYGNLLTPEARTKFQQVSTQKYRGAFVRNTAQEFFDKGMTPEQAEAELRKRIADNVSEGGRNVIDDVRALKGKISFYDNEGGTNCMRTMGIALKGTPYEGQINVDQAIATAKENNQLMSPDGYTPRPGDLAVNEDGWHIVMVTENGGTIQNGKSKNGVYESEYSAAQMSSDGKVKYYIRTSDYMGNNADKGFNYSDEDIDAIKQRMIVLDNDRRRRENRALSDAYDSVYQQAWQLEKQGVSFEDAFAKLVTNAGYSDAKSEKNAEKAVLAIYGKKSAGSKGSGGAGNDSEYGKGSHAVAVLAIKEMFPRFGTKADMVEYTKTKNLSETDTGKLMTAWKQYEDGTGEFAYKWNDIKDRVMGGDSSLPAEQKSEMWANCRAAGVQFIFDFMRNPENRGAMPTDEQIIDACKKAKVKTAYFTYETPGKYWGTNESTFEVSSGVLNRAGIKDVRPYDETHVLVFYKSGKMAVELKNEFVDKFPGIQ